MKGPLYILCIETSAARCSVALCRDGVVVGSRSDDNRCHASLTAVFCSEVLSEAGLKASDLDAVCISDGPGSYTGLRVGLSTAKGICFGAGIRLLSVSSLDVLSVVGLEMLRGGGLDECVSGDVQYVVPMLDARRMEVYTATYAVAGTPTTSSGMSGSAQDLLPERISEIRAEVIGEGAFGDIASNALFIGDGAVKCREAIGRGLFVEALPDARAMASLALREYKKGAWRDVAYFEPFYLKEFTATVSKKKLL